MKLKNIFLLIALVAFLGTTFGKSVDVNTARKAASTFASTISKTKSAEDLNLVYTASNETSTQNYFYVFNTENGFVMIAGDDNIIPVLAYSTEGQFVTENIPAHIAVFFKDYEIIIQKAIDNPVVRTPEIAQQWKDLMNGSVSVAKGTNAVSPLLTDSWGQAGTNTKPTYNAKCPSYNGKYAVTGCMATVMSQIIRYHKYPTKGYGSHSYKPERFPNRYGTLSCNFANTTFDFNNMPDRLSPATSSTTQINAVATLMSACGIASEMDYGTEDDGGSGTSLMSTMGRVHSGEYAMKQYFNYPLATIITRDLMTDAEFLAAIKADLDKKLPVAITGFGNDNEGGHVFACDGYDNSNKVHINWGWEGQQNGYFTITKLTTREYDFSYYNQALIKLIPGNKISSMADNCLVLNSKATTNPTTIPCGTNFTFTANLINKGGKVFDGELRAFASREDFSMMKQIGDNVSANIAAGANKAITFTSTGIDGVYTGLNYLMIEYKAKNSSEWVRVAGLGANTMPVAATFTGETKVTTRPPYNITGSTATFYASIEPGCANIASRGFEYKKANESNYKATYETSNTMTTTVRGLQPNTTYKVRVWCLMNGQRQYTNDQTFTTKSSGIEDLNIGDITIYPNPAKENLHIDLTASAQKIEKVELINSLGQSMYIIHTPANTLHTIPTTQYANGLYFIRLTSSEGVVTKKVLISK